MICKCKIKMACVIDDYDTNKNEYLGSYYHCPSCGRLRYKVDPKCKIKYGDKSFWIEPEYLNDNSR